MIRSLGVRRWCRCVVAAVLVALGVGLVPVVAAPAGANTTGGLVIAAVYSDYSDSGATYNQQFVELFNSGSTDVSLGGYSLQEASATGSFSNTVAREVDLPAQTLVPGQHFLIGGISGGAGAAITPTPDMPTTSFQLGVNNATVFLVSSTTALTSSTYKTSATVVDEVGFGTAPIFLGAGTAPAGTPTTADFRDDNGCANSSNNGADFSAVALATVTLDNSSSPATPCSTGGGTTTSTTTTTAPSTTTTTTTTPPSSGHATAGGLVISAVYSQGGDPGAAWSTGFIELFNSGTTPVSLSGWTLQYESAASFHPERTTPLNSAATLPSGGYYLIATSANSQNDGSGSTLTPHPDQTSTVLDLGDVSGTVFLVHGTTNISSQSDPSIVDEVGYGSPDSYLASPAPAGAAATIDARNDRGCTNSLDNAADFSAVPAATTAVYGSTSPAAPCGPEAPAADQALDISAIYGGGGDAGSYFANDFVELFNSGTAAASLAGFSLQLFAADGTPVPNGLVVLDDVTIPAGGYYLLAGANNNEGDESDLSVAPDQTAPSFDVPDGVATAMLVYGTDPITSLPSRTVLDSVSTGSTPYVVGSPALALTATTADYRNGSGCTDTDNNGLDFSSLTAETTPLYNTASPLYLCSLAQKPTYTVTTLPPSTGNGAAVTTNGNGQLYVTETGSSLVESMTTAGGSATRVAGVSGASGESGDGGPALSATLSYPAGIAIDAAGDVFVADTGDNVVREILAANHEIVLYAGNGTAGYKGNGGPATSAELYSPEGLALDTAGDLFIADSGNNVIREVTPAGTISTVAGDGTFGHGGDGGRATSAQLATPYGVAVDSADNLYIADSANNLIRRVSALYGTITTVAGNYPAYAGNNYAQAYTGDGGPATEAQLNDPQGIAVNQAGDLFVADTANRAVRMVTPAGIISTIAANPPLQPEGVTVDNTTGDVYAADADSGKIYAISGLSVPGPPAPGPGADVPNPALPESPLVVALPASAAAIVGFLAIYRSRRRKTTRSEGSHT